MPPDFIYALPHGGMFLVILAIVGGIAFALHVLVARWPLKGISQRLPELSPAIITLCGTLFGLSVTFLANSVWTAEDRARQMVNTEARDIRVIRVYMDQLHRPHAGRLHPPHHGLCQCGGRRMERMTDASARAPAERELRNIYAAAINGLSEGEQNRMIQQRLLVALDSLSAARQQRLSMAQDVVSAGQWLLVSGLGVAAAGHGGAGPCALSAAARRCHGGDDGGDHAGAVRHRGARPPLPRLFRAFSAAYPARGGRCAVRPIPWSSCTSAGRYRRG